MRESLGGASFADVVITTFFGFDPDIKGLQLLIDPDTPRQFKGILRNIHFRGKEYNLGANAAGVTIQK